MYQSSGATSTSGSSADWAATQSSYAVSRTNTVRSEATSRSSPFTASA